MSEKKIQFYSTLNKQLGSLLSNERSKITNLSQFSAFINSNLDDINWVGFYLSQTNGDLLLGPFQGNIACTRIPLGKGVCGTAAKEKKAMKVSNVEEFAGHIACDSRSRSELVFPVIINTQLIGVLDIDSPSLNRFDNEDLNGVGVLLETLIEMTDMVPSN